MIGRALLERGRPRALQTSGTLSMDTDNEPCTDTYGLLVASRKAEVAGRFTIPTETMPTIQPGHEISADPT